MTSFTAQASMMRRALFLLLCLAPAASAAPGKPEPGGLEFFEKKIRPVLVEHCYKCHSAEAQAKKKLRGGLRLDTREGLLEGGDSGPAVVPGKAKESLLYKSLLHDGEIKMPPAGKLSEGVLKDVEAWINRGAPDPRTGKVVKAKGMSVEDGRKFWAYVPPRRATIPDVKDRDWANSAIDRFVLSAMEAKGLRPAADADRVTIVRRLSFDLAGLAPTPEEIDEFVNDKSPDAYERLVDRLLSSPRFGERWGRHWLDLARYAESLTLRGFVLKDAWRYRDYVIETFDDDAPLDRFFREQVAGDLMPGDSASLKRRQLVATSFLAMGNTNLEEQDKKQLRMDVVDEQLDTIGRAFLAQTIGCARCHDHKFDPIPTKDYYALAGILRNTRTLTHANVSQWLSVPLPADPEREKELKAHESVVAKLQAQINSLKSAVAKNTKLDPKKPKVRAISDLPGIVVDDAKAKKVGEWKESKYSGAYVGAGYVHDNNEKKGQKTITFQPEIVKTGKYEVWLAYSAASNRDAKVPVTVFSADGEKTIHVDQRKQPDVEGLFVSLGQHRFEKSGQGFVIIENENTTGHVIADAVVFIPVEELKARSASEGKKTDSKDAAKLGQLEVQMKKLTDAGPKRETALSVTEEATIEDTSVHVRGSVHNLGDKAARGFLQVATAGKAPTMPTKESGRLQLGEWLASADNPLTARVFVNRVWHWLFGSGIVRTVDNFGTTGETPSHPELLDHLAIRFVEEGWSVKKLVRAIVLSRTYRQSSVASPQAREKDPENRLFSHTNRRRLEAECIRDTILSVSGQLSNDRGGPTYRPTLAADYGFKHGDSRRSVYVPVFRNSLPEIFEVFDFADPSVTTGRRNVSTVVPQALFMTNHPFAQDQARLAAKRLLANGKLDESGRVTLAYRWALGRPPSDGERRLITQFVAHEKNADEAWSQAFGVLFASLDFRHVE
jgi:hypothetical protein